ncbi:DUF4493 domain-containing protein [Phocaeicola plebeius]|uniref:DUF4493 domain-containing protein n=1 Tax=Phocaeicola plebeius TaxID=310297 RepID=UPI0021AC5DE1|nr:DUF4493 domain-containing protein [Phocaeicola plebeius]MCR8882835.1 DUF4493 domain-containing protein [Phocaeicola plebeius]MDM8287056.1 DUF4493 domain-containing protein [Phocaeicola plebeius]
MNKGRDKNMKWFNSLLLLLCGMWLGGCQQEDDFRSSAQTGFQITLTDEANQAYSRTAPDKLEDPATSMFRLRVVDATTGKVAYSGKCTESVLVKEGTYNLTATYGENPVIGLDTPYYEGTLENQQVVTGQMTSATIPCAVANALLSVNYDAESLKKVYEDYSVTVSVYGQSVEIDSTGVKSAYFKADSSVKLVFHGHLAGTGKEVSYDIPEPEGSPFSNISAKTHVKITLGTDSITSSGVGISVEKVKVSKVSVTETLPLEFLPKPKLESKGFVNNELSFAETEEKSAVINLKLSSPLQNIKLKFNSTDAKFAGLEADKEYLLSNAVDKAAIEAALGITLPEIGATTGSLDFTSLIPQLMTDAGNTVASTIEVDVKANNRWASEDKAANRVYTLKCNKPIFHVSVYPGNIWTKEFTMNPLLAEDVETGNYDLLSQKMKYQFSVDGQTNWIDFSDDLRKSDLAPGTNYYIRGVYRDVVEGEIVAVKTYETLSIPNSTLDEGYSTTYPKSNNPLYNFNGGWIGTRNTLTCHSNGVNAFYVSKSSTLPINENGSTVAHLMTIGWGAGNTCSFGNKFGSVINNVSAGILCVGDYEASGDTIYAKVASIRPTSLNFTYKSAPYNGDEYLVEIALVNISENVETVIGSARLTSGEKIDSYKTQSMDVVYNDAYKQLPITHVRILFKAGINENKDYLEDKFRDAYIWEGYTNAYLVGSQFWLDSFSLVYDK